MSLKELFDSCSDRCEPAGAVRFDWSAKGVGWGSFSFYLGDDGYVHCDNEIMSRQFVKEMLCKMVDNAVFTEPNDRHADIGVDGKPPGYSPKAPLNDINIASRQSKRRKPRA